MCNVLALSPLPILATPGPLAVWDAVWPYLVMFLGFSVIVFVHELGHFAVAKWAGVRVEKFAIGFGREIFGATYGETRYSFNVLPLGGYVKMLGQEDFEDKAQELQFKDDPRSFINKSVGRRMAIVSAGVIMNVLFACLLFMVVFLVGVNVEGTRIAHVVPDSPADRAGLQPGDVIRRINGDKVLEFNEVRMEIILAPPHEPIEFVVQRDGERKSIAVRPERHIPESIRDIQRQIVGIRSGVTREIMYVGPEMNPTRPDHPHVGDVIVEINGVPVTESNVNEVVDMLAYAPGDVVVERKDPTHPDAPPERVKVKIPPRLAIYPTTDRGQPAVNVLGLEPLVRFSAVPPRSRAYLAGIEDGDTVRNWDDVPYPTRATITRAIQDHAGRDVYFEVQHLTGRTSAGFVRPKANPRGPATIHAVARPLAEDDRVPGGPQAWFSDVRPGGPAARAGIDPGDVVLACGDVPYPTMTELNRAIRTQTGEPLLITVRKPNGGDVVARVIPQAPGTIGAQYDLVAEDVLRVAGVAKVIAGRPSPAARAGISRGSLITAVAGEGVFNWRELIDAFRRHAGADVAVTYLGPDDDVHVANFPVPHSLRTLLGVGPEARILSIAGRKTVDLEGSYGPEEVAVGYREGTRAILEKLVGTTHVPVAFRRNPLAPAETGYVDVTSDMVDPWLGRISFTPNVELLPEFKILKGENALDAVLIGIHKTYYFVLTVYRTFQRMFFTRSVGLESVSGPLGIINMGGTIARQGWVEFIFFMAIISANLAVINFLPLPIVDGGLMVFLIIEKIKGSPVSLRVQMATQLIGLCLIVGVFLLVTFNDAMRLWG